MQENEESDPRPSSRYVGFGGLDGKTLEPNTSQPWLEATETGKCGIISSSLLERSQSTQTSGVHIPLLVRPISLHPRALVLNHSVVQIFWIIENISIIYLLLSRKCILVFFVVVVLLYLWLKRKIILRRACFQVHLIVLKGIIRIGINQISLNNSSNFSYNF